MSFLSCMCSIHWFISLVPPIIVCLFTYRFGMNLRCYIPPRIESSNIKTGPLEVRLCSIFRLDPVAVCCWIWGCALLGVKLVVVADWLSDCRTTGCLPVEAGSLIERFSSASDSYLFDVTIAYVHTSFGGVSKTQTRSRGRGRGLLFFFFFLIFFFAFFFLFSSFCFLCCLFFSMIIMAIINGSGQMVNYTLRIRLNGHVINHHFSHVGRTNAWALSI